MSNIKISQLPNLANLASGTQFPVANNSGSFSVTSDTIKNYVVGAGFTSSGNITASYLFGNGSQLTGIDATSIQNGTSAVSVISSGGNVRANVAGATVQVLSTGGADVTGYVTASGNVSGGNLVTAGNVYAPAIINNGAYNTKIELGAASGVIAVTTDGNATQFLPGGQIRLSPAGAKTILSGTLDGSQLVLGTSQTDLVQNRAGNVTVQVGTGGTTNSTWTFAQDGNLYAPGNISASGNITGSFILGNGSQLTGIDATSIQSGTSNVKVVSSGGNVTTSVGGTSNVVIVTTTGANIAGTLNATGNANVGNLGATNVVATNLSGTIQTAAQPNITSLGTLGSLAVSGNITPGGIFMNAGNATIGNLYVSGTTTIAGNIQQISGNSGQFFGNASTGFNALYAGLPAGFNLLPQSVVNFVSQFEGYSQLNNQNQSAGNTATADYVLTSNNGDDLTYYSSYGIASSTYDGATAVLDNAMGTSVTPNDTYLYTTGNVAAGNPSDLVLGAVDVGGQIRFAVGGSMAANVAMKVNAPNTAATSNTTGTLNVLGGISTSGAVWATGNVTGAYFIGNGSQLTGIDATAIQNGTANVRTFLNGNVTISAAGSANVLIVTSTGANIAGTLNTGTGNANLGNVGATNVVATNLTGTLQTASQTAITGVGALNAGSITSGFGTIDIGTDTITVGGIINANANGTGNIGSASVYFNTVFAKATSAQYADLAEKYEADAEYAPGTVLAFGGDAEVTLSTEEGSTRVAGVVSTNPSYIMNAGLTATHVAMVALQGRVPCRVIGPVRKGDMMVAATNGAAKVDNAARAGTIIGKALENFDGAQGTIEIVVGRN